VFDVIVYIRNIVTKMSADEELTVLSAAAEAAAIALRAFSVKRRKTSQTILEASVVRTSPP